MTHSRRSMLVSFSLVVCIAAFGCQPSAPKKSDSSAAPAAVKAPAPAPAPSANREYNDAARFIAGMQPEPGSTLAEQSARPEWVKYAASFDKNWAKLDSTRMAPMRKWAGEELHGANSPIVFYPFSGPDFLYATTFFPNADTYVLVALEPTGTVPDFHQMTPDAMDQFFATVDRSLDSVLSFSFFKTDNMKVDVKQDLEGTLPILMLFLARTGNRVDDVRAVEIDGAGNIVAAGTAKLAAGERPAKGVDIAFKGAEGSKHLYYFSVNIQNDYLKKSVFTAYMTKLNGADTYLKSASYLLHKSYFSTVRDAILNRSAMLVQDDSGIPYRFLKHDKWDVSLYGVYSSPIAMFKDHKEDDLVDAYKEANRAKPLPFGIGYNWRTGNSNLLVARKKAGA